MTPRRDWSDARQKIEAESRCRRCLRGDVKLDAAHILGRRYDRPRVDGSTSKVLYVHPDSVIPLCADRIEANGTPVEGCHSLYDSKKIGILPFLTREEQIRAVEDAGAIEVARRRLDPLDYVDPIRNARIEAIIEAIGETGIR